MHTNGVTYRYLENETKKELEFEAQFHPLSPPCRQYSEHIMAIPFLMERHHFGKGKFTKVTFQHNAPADISWHEKICLLYTSPSPRDATLSRMPSSA